MNNSYVGSRYIITLNNKVIKIYNKRKKGK